MKITLEHNQIVKIIMDHVKGNFGVEFAGNDDISLFINGIEHRIPNLKLVLKSNGHDKEPLMTGSGD